MYVITFWVSDKYGTRKGVHVCYSEYEKHLFIEKIKRSKTMEYISDWKE